MNNMLSRVGAFARFRFALASSNRKKWGFGGIRVVFLMLWALHGVVVDLRWILRWVFGPRVKWSRPERVCLVLLSYGRPHNMDFLARIALKCDCIGKIIVKNNHPDVEIAKWVVVRDPRLVLLDGGAAKQGIRWNLAAAESFDYFLSIDDDYFMSPAQITELVARLVESPEVPHGSAGEVYTTDDSRRPWFPQYLYEVGITRKNRSVDHLTNVYACTKAHITRALQLAVELDIGPLEALGNGEDILLSFTGTGHPRIHDVGKVRECVSAHIEGIATSQTLGGFWAERIRLSDELGRITARSKVEQSTPNGLPSEPRPSAAER